MSQKVCAIAGFGTGVSTGVAKAFAQEGYSLALLARNPVKLIENAQTLQQEGYIVQTFAADAGDKASLSQAFDQIRTQIGDPEILIYNAAAFTPGKPSAIAFEQLIADFQVECCWGVGCCTTSNSRHESQRKGDNLIYRRWLGAESVGRCFVSGDR